MQNAPLLSILRLVRVFLSTPVTLLQPVILFQRVRCQTFLSRISLDSVIALLTKLLLSDLVEPENTNPCLPSPCGPYSECRQINNHAVCSCQKGYVGSSPACKPECVVSSECAQNKACIKQKCVDPCPNTCGQNARCQVVNHNPICSCPPGYSGDPFVRCLPERKH